MGEEAAAPGRASRAPGRRGFEREPFVEDERIVAVAIVEGGERGVALVERRSRSGSRARRADRSCCRPSAKRSTTLGDRRRIAVGDEEVERGIGERAPAGRGGVGREGAAPPSVGKTASSRPPMRSAIAARSRLRAAAIASGSTSRPISRAMSASPGSCSTWARKAGSSASFSATSPSASISAGSIVDRLAARGRGGRRRSASRMASVCAACQRLNGSASVRSRNRRSSG